MTWSYLQDVDEDILLWLFGAANILQDDGVVDALGVRLIQVICIRLVPLLEGEEDLVLICTYYLDVLEDGIREDKKRRSQCQTGTSSIFWINDAENEKLEVVKN